MLVLRNIAAGITCFALMISLYAATSSSRVVFILGTVLALASATMGIRSVIGTHVNKQDRVALMAPTVLNVVGVIGLLLFVESGAMRSLIILGTTLMHAAYVTHAFFYVNVPTRYTPHALESVSSFLHSISLFSFATATFGLALFTEIPFALLMIPCLVAVYIVMLHSLWITKIPMERAKTLAALGVAMFAQAMIAFSLLPTSLFVNGAALTLIAYIMHFHFRVTPADPHFKPTAHRATLLASSLFVMLLISAPWR